MSTLAMTKELLFALSILAVEAEEAVVMNLKKITSQQQNQEGNNSIY